MRILSIFKHQNKDEDRYLKAISKAYKKREKELESLLKYDRGEKKIDAPELSTYL